MFKPPSASVAAQKGWEKDLEMTEKVLRYQIDEEGSYSIGGVWGGKCLGEVKEPSEIKAEMVEIPEVDMEIKRLQDDWYVQHSSFDLSSTELTGIGVACPLLLVPASSVLSRPSPSAVPLRSPSSTPFSTTRTLLRS